MRSLTTDVLRELLEDKVSPCISLYQPTHRAVPDKRQDPIRFRNLIREAEQSLLEKYPIREVRPLLEPFQVLADDEEFWKNQRDGLAVLAGGGRFDVFRLQRTVQELVVVANSFHVKPLLRIIQSADRYQVLCLDRHKASLFEGNRDALDEVEVDDLPTTVTEALGEPVTKRRTRLAYSARPVVFYGQKGGEDEVEKDLERFFQIIDREVTDRFSHPSRLPLYLVALPEYQTEFHRISQNPYLQPVGVEKHPESLTPEQLRTEVWRVVEPSYLNRLARLIDDFRTAETRNMAASDVRDVARAAVARQISVLLVDADRVIPGRFNPETGEVTRDRLADPDVDDLIDDLAEAVLKAGGEVVVVPTERMPTKTGLAATFRPVD